MLAQAVLGRQAAAQQRVDAERVADHRIPAGAVGAHRERIEARAAGCRRRPLERAAQIVGDRRRRRDAVARLRRDVVGGVQRVVVEAVAALEDRAVAEQVGAEARGIHIACPCRPAPDCPASLA